MGTMNILTRIIIGWIALGIFSGEAVAQTASLPQRHIIQIEAFAFQPTQIHVSPGDSIVWVNNDLVPHFLNIAEGQWQSPVIEEGQSWEMMVDQAGRYTYLCVFHPKMTGEFSAE
jgi:plastocyanin